MLLDMSVLACLFAWPVVGIQSRGKSEIMDLLILSEIMDFRPSLLLKSTISDTITQSIISDFPPLLTPYRAAGRPLEC
jgi:hypothetical protein